MITSKELWQQFIDDKGVSSDTPYDVWHFGDESMADALGELVFKGIKRATTSLKAEYDYDGDSLPLVDEYSVITDSKNRPLCIIKTVSVEERLFKNVDEAFAEVEGEGDKSLTYWRNAHISFFKDVCSRIGLDFNEDMTVVLEKFEVVYKNDFIEFK